MATEIFVDRSVDILPPREEDVNKEEEKIDAQGEGVVNDIPSSSSPVSPNMKDGANNVLAEVVREQAERIKELEASLQDARKLIDNREKLLAALQWKPKEDYYAWKNPTINDKTVRDAQERKLKTLLEQMRVMEKMLAERDQVLNSMVLSGSNNSLTQSGGASPFASPMGQRASPAAQPSWSRSPSSSPALFSSTQITQSAPSPTPTEGKALSSSWWFFKRTSSFPNVQPNGSPNSMAKSGGMGSSVGSPSSSPSPVRSV